MSATLKLVSDAYAPYNREAWFEYLEKAITGRLRHHFVAAAEPFVLPDVPPSIALAPDYLGRFITERKLPREEVLVLLLSMAVHLQPQFFDQLIQKNLPANGDYPQLGGVRGQNSRSFLPTGETALFLLAGNDVDERISCQRVFETDHLFGKLHVLWLGDVPLGEPRMSGRIILNPEYLELFTRGQVKLPRLSMNFPAQHLSTELSWTDIVLNDTTAAQIEELQQWVQYKDKLMREWGMAKKLKPGYRALFYGPPGTGKTLTATLLGKHTGKEVFKVDLSMVVSKFIGETEKNLAQLFARAENKDWILFFDEADALFSKRTHVRDAHDKYANQEAAYLLQRIETFDGLVILATNFKNNMDEAFIRRFHSVIHFPLPDPAERLQIWQKGFPQKAILANDLDLVAIAKKFDLSGAAIIHIIQYACLQALAQGGNTIHNEMLLSGIRKEYLKEGKVW